MRSGKLVSRPMNQHAAAHNGMQSCAVLCGCLLAITFEVIRTALLLFPQALQQSIFLSSISI